MQDDALPSRVRAESRNHLISSRLAFDIANQPVASDLGSANVWSDCWLATDHIARELRGLVSNTHAHDSLVLYVLRCTSPSVRCCA
eukprot:5296950-Amphidinium_carterae.1